MSEKTGSPLLYPSPMFAPYHQRMGDDTALTELAGIAEAETESVQAWALDYDDHVPTQRFTGRRITTGALIGCLVLIAAAGVVALLAIRGLWATTQTQTPVTAPTTPLTTPPVKAAPRPWFTPTPAPPRVEPAPVQAPPPQGITVEQLAAYDRQFVANLQARGWRIYNPLTITQQAHQVCAALANGASPAWVANQFIGPTTPLSDAQQFVTTATLTYPSCP